MSSRQDTVDFLLECLAQVDEVRAKRMFGEFGLYVGDRFVAVVCDDVLFMKPTEAGRRFFPEFTERPPFPGAKPWLVVPGDRWDGSQWLRELFLLTAREVEPVPARKRSQRIRPGRD